MRNTRVIIYTVVVLVASVTTVANVCHCKTSCATFPDTECDSDGCQEGWFGPYCQKENIAFQRPTTQSSTYTQTGGDHLTFPSHLAVDGFTTNIFNSLPTTCTHTAERNNPSWTVYLNKTASQQIRQIKLYLRTQRPDRNNGMAIRVDGQECYRWLSRPPTTVNIRCNQGLPGNNVTITVTSQILSLCEVQIFLCSDGWFGNDCENQCNCLDKTKICYKTSGFCLGGCAAGYKSTNCLTPCGDYTFGVNCDMTCLNCFHNEVCEKTTGRCPRGCQPGWMNDTCLQPCTDGKFGVNCSMSCGNCLDNEVCEMRTGTCSRGCQPGWMNDTCLQPCTDGTFGVGCSNNCGNCFNNEVCEKTTGRCPRGCQSGWMNDTCFQPCKDGLYGSGCTSVCGHCKDGSVCDRTTGHCVDGCQGNYTEPNCKDCLDGTFGISCNETCGMCKDGGPCIKTSGQCPSGCQSGYTDQLCRTPLPPEPESQLGVVAGAAGGAVAGLLLVLLIVGFIIFRRRRQTQDRKHPNAINSHLVSMNDTIDGNQVTDPRGVNGPKGDETEDEDAAFSVETEEVGTGEDASTYYNWVPPNMTLEKLHHLVQDKKSRSTLETQFKTIPYGLKGVHDVGKKPENKVKNRFAALYPYDHSRVVLNDDGDDYINANYINGFDDSPKYIATQGPKPVTVVDLWRMIWQEGVTSVVMLTQLVELNKKKSEQYWPGESESKQYGKFTVTNKEVKVRPDYTISSLLVQIPRSKERSVRHFHYTSWPDHGVPSAPALVNFWKKVKQEDKTAGPLVVHCSAGVGRTGAFISLDYLFEGYTNQETVNVFTCVTRMREARMNMVQTLPQYQFVHDAVLEAVHSRQTLHTASQLTAMFGNDNVYTEMEDTIKQHFKLLNELRPEFSSDDVSDALLPENANKNIDKGILPGNKSRLHLSSPPPGRNSYINAVALPSAVRASMLVVTQTPLTDTVVDFWTLVIDHDCFTLVCLDDSQEAQAMYPQTQDSLQCGPFSVRLTDTKQTDVYTERQIVLTNTKKKDASQKITVYNFKSLHTMSRDTTSLLELVNRVDRVICSADHKVLVHCCDGARLSGLFCTALNVIGQVKLDNEVDIFLTIRELQCIRPQFIRTHEQYKLCYDLVRENHLSSSVYANL